MSNKQVSKTGRVPASQDETISADLLADDLDYNVLKLDPEFHAKLNAEGLVCRWINATKYSTGGNFHQSGWRAYKMKLEGDRGSMDFNFGVSPEGYIIRNDLLLAVKPIQHQEVWKARLKKKAQMQSVSDSSRADALRDAAANSGLKAKVLEGYEGNE